MDHSEAGRTAGVEHTEQELLMMAEHFKELIKAKNNLLSKLKKLLLLCYGLSRVADDAQDGTCVEILRQYLSSALTEHFGVEEYED